MPRAPQMAISQGGGTAHLSFLQSFSFSSELQGGSSDNVCCTGTERLSLWSSLSRCYCGSTDTFSPSPSPSKRRGRGRLLTPSLLSGRTRETCSSLVKTPPPLEVVEIFSNDESSIAEPSQPLRPKLSSSSSEGEKEDQQDSQIDNLHMRRGRAQSSKQHVRWKTSGEESESQESNELPEQELHRTEKKRKTLNTWMSALLDVSEGGFDTTVVPEPASPARSHWSFRSHRTATLLPPSPTGVSPASGKSRGWRTPEGSVTSSPAKSNVSPISPPGQVSILCLLRGHFLGNVDADGSGHFTREELFDHIKELLERTSGSLGSEDLELLGEVVKCRFSEMDLHSGAGQQGLGMDEWVHFMLLRASAPSHVAAKHLNRHLRKSLEESPELLTRLHAAFEAADDTGDGLIRQEKWLAAFEAVGMSQPPDEILEDREEDGSPWALSYYEFLAHALGLKASVVELVLYDLSQGVAQWIPGSLLGGHQLDGIWHSGLRVFGKEFWFGGVILESKYEDVPFGVPKQVIRLGTTLRTYEDMVEFLKEDLYVDYNPRSYDVLRRNCNHFANELAQFLLHGKQLPDDVLMQPEWVQDAMLVRFLRPVLNRWLGGFGDALNAGGADELPQAVSRVDDLTEEWRCRLQPGDVVMHRHRFIDRPRAVRLLFIETGESGRRTAAIRCLRPTAAEELSPSSWEMVHQTGVPLRQFYPILEEDPGAAHILRAGLAIRHAQARKVLQRPRGTPTHAACTKGHVLKPEEGYAWWPTLMQKVCGVCQCTISNSCTAWQCERCNVTLCQACLQSANSLPGGGLFVDVLSPELARALLDNDQWLRYKAKAYFFKADHVAAGFLDKAKIRRVENRLAAELGTKPLSDTELLRELRDLIDRSGVDSFSPLEVRESTFQQFFAAALSRALALLQSGKHWHPHSRKKGARTGSKGSQ